MANYTFAQLEALWITNGGSATVAPIAAAIAMAESGGNSQATDNDANGTTDRGLWQINSVWGTESTYDVTGNTKAAISISNNGKNWTPWTTFTSGAYRKFLSVVSPEALTAAEAYVTGKGGPKQPSPSTDGGAGSLSIATSGSDVPGWVSDIPGLGWLVGTASDVSDIATALQDATNMFALLFKPSLWFRVGAFLAGTVLLAFGIYMLAKTIDPDLHLPSPPSVMPIPVPV